MKHIKIALTGKMRAGKDTVFKLIEDELLGSYNKIQVVHHSFGGQLKHYANELFPDKIKGGKPRKLYQDFGQTMRQIDPDVWIKKVDERMSHEEGYIMYFNKEDKGAVVSIVTDLRQPNEYKYCRDNGFYTIRVKASDRTRQARMKETGDAVSLADLNHETEKHIDTYKVDYEIENDGLTHNSIFSVELQVEQIISDIIKKEGNPHE